MRASQESPSSNMTLSLGLYSFLALSILFVTALACVIPDLPRPRWKWNRYKRVKWLNAQSVALDSFTANKGVNAICQFASAYNPDWIIGIHTDGRLLSVYVAHKLGMNPNRCIFIKTMRIRSRERNYQLPMISTLDNKNLNGRILVIDGITRSGTTLDRVRSYIFDELQSRTNQKVKDIRFAVLTVVRQRDDSGMLTIPRFRPNFYPLSTENNEIKLPWSLLSDKTSYSFSNQISDEFVGEYFINLYEELGNNFNLALWLARLALTNPNEFNEYVENMNIIERFSLLNEVPSDLKS